MKLYYAFLLALLFVACGDKDNSVASVDDLNVSSSNENLSSNSVERSSSSKTGSSSSFTIESSSSSKLLSSSSVQNSLSSGGEASSSSAESSSSREKNESSSSVKNLSSSEDAASSSSTEQSSSGEELSSSSEFDLSQVTDEENTEGLVCDEEGKRATGVIDTTRRYYCTAAKQWIDIDDYFFSSIPIELYVNKDFEYGSLTDSRDGQTYRTAKIGKQVWMAENLNFSKFTNGDADAVLEENLWRETECHQSDRDCEKAGRLYSWTAAMNQDSKYKDGRVPEGEIWLEHQGVCPDGWHIPNNADWRELGNYVGKLEGSDNVASSLQSVNGWGVDRLDKYGFTAFPVFQNYSHNEAHFWSVEEYNTKKYEDRANYAYTLDLQEDSYGLVAVSKSLKKSVRCVQNRGNVENIKDDATGLLSHTFEREQIFSSNVQYGSFKDERDGTVYKTVVIGNQEWFAENLNYKTIYGSFCYDDNAANCEVYGRLYDRKAAKAKQNELYRDVCPIGWHIPSKSEWNTLASYVASQTDTPVGTALKSSVGFSCNENRCDTPAPTGTNEFGFSAVGAGWNLSGQMANEGVVAMFWMGDQTTSSKQLLYRTETLDDNNFSSNISYRLSIRCLKN